MDKSPQKNKVISIPLKKTKSNESSLKIPIKSKNPTDGLKIKPTVSKLELSPGKKQQLSKLSLNTKKTPIVAIKPKTSGIE